MPPRKRTATKTTATKTTATKRPAKRATAKPRKTKAQLDAERLEREAAELAAQVDRARRLLELRRDGISWRAAAVELEVDDREDLLELYQLALDEEIQQSPNDVRRLELIRLDRLIGKLKGAVDEGDVAAIRESARLGKLRVEIAQRQAPLHPTGRPLGKVEASTLAELERLRVTDNSLAASALVQARAVDEAAPSSTVGIQAAREHRILMTALRSVYGDGDAPTRPVGGGEEDTPADKATGTEGATVTPPSRLEQLRARAADKGGKRGK